MLRVLILIVLFVAICVASVQISELYQTTYGPEGRIAGLPFVILLVVAWCGLAITMFWQWTKSYAAFREHGRR